MNIRGMPRALSILGAILCALLIIDNVNAQNPDLPSWNDGAAKQAIITFVNKVTNKSGTGYVAPQDRIATFDQDGTLWVEQPLYAQAAFALDRIHVLAQQHPEWTKRQPFKAVLTNDRKAIGKFSESDWAMVLAATHAGMSNEAFQQIVKDWLAQVRDSRFHRPYTDLVYQPMLELMHFLRANGFRTYIVTWGGQEFVRVYSERVYGVPPEQVVGSSILTQYQYQNGKPILMREPKVFFVDDHGGKPVGINLFMVSVPSRLSVIRPATSRCLNGPRQAMAHD